MDLSMSDVQCVPKPGRPSKPLPLFKKARALVKRCPCLGTTDQQACQMLEEVISLLTVPNVIAKLEPAQHSLDLDLDDKAYLLSSAYLELARLKQRDRCWEAASQLLRDSLKWFPASVAAKLALAQVLRITASAQKDLLEVEQLLRSCIAGAQELQILEDGMLDANPACRHEMGCLGAAQTGLSMLLCQEGRDEEAKELLRSLGFSYRISREVLCYDSAIPTHVEPAVLAACKPYVQAVDDALPAALLERLQRAFAPSSPFWSEHDYGRTGYFSYMHKLGSEPCSLMHQLTAHLHAMAVRLFPSVRNALYAEWWAHCRHHTAGHQLHFDSDDEGVGGVRNPIISCVVCLTADVGGPTLVTNQTLSGKLADQGWLAYPRVNRVTMFDGCFLHGVIPGRGPSPVPNGTRTTLMVAFWPDLKSRQPVGGVPCSSMPFPAMDSNLTHTEQPRARTTATNCCQPSSSVRSMATRAATHAVRDTATNAVRDTAANAVINVNPSDSQCQTAGLGRNAAAIKTCDQKPGSSPDSERKVIVNGSSSKQPHAAVDPVVLSIGSCSIGQQSWLCLMGKVPEPLLAGSWTWKQSLAAVRPVQIVWCPVDEGSKAVAATYDACFQGF